LVNYCTDEKNEQEKSKTEENTTHHKSLITVMVESGMSDSDIRDNVGIFFLAGHETTASTLSWALSLIARHPEIQEKARKEVLEHTKEGMTYETMKDLNYLDWIIHETMRIYPAVPVVGQRRVETETILGDWKIPENTTLQMDFISMLHKAEIWGDPEKFRPERFNPENLTKEQRTSWIPFSYGPRICIGMNFSLLEQKIFLATILRQFSSITLPTNSVVVPDSKSFLYAPNYDKFTVQFCE